MGKVFATGYTQDGNQIAYDYFDNNSSQDGISICTTDVLSIMDSEETGEYRDHSLSETNWGLEFGNPDKCIGFVAVNNDSKYFKITLISK